MAFNCVLWWTDYLLYFLFNDSPVIIENILEIYDLKFTECIPFPWDVSKRVDDVKTELKASKDEFIKCLKDVAMDWRVGFDEILHFGIDVFD